MTEHAHVELHDLAELWERSSGAPHTVFAQEDPQIESGTYVINPGERVPASGATSHDGPELSVILSGEAVIGRPGAGGAEERTVPPGTFSLIPAGVEHYSANRGDEPVRLVYTLVGGL